MAMLVRKRGGSILTPVLNSFGAAHTSSASNTQTASLTLLSQANATSGAVGDLVVGFVTCDGGRTIATTSTGVARAWVAAPDPALAILRYVQPHPTNAQTASLTNGGNGEDWAMARLGARFAETDETKWVYGSSTTTTGTTINTPPLTSPQGVKPYIWVAVIATAARNATSAAPSGWQQHTIQTGTLASMNAGLTVIYRVAEASSMTFPSVTMAASGAARTMSLAIPGAQG